MPKAPAKPTIVEPGAETKSGCYWCPLFPLGSDFKDQAELFQRDASKIIEKNRDGHRILTRCVSEEWTKVRVLFVSEAPGRDEDKQGRPLAGGPGGMLRKTIANATSLKEADYGFANIVSCRPPRNRTPNNTEVQSCSPKLLREIAARKPELVVVLGNTALKFLTGQSGITSLQGKVLDCIRPEFPGLKVLACLNPAYVLRFDHELDKFFNAIGMIDSLLDGTFKQLLGVGKYEVLTDIDVIEERFKQIRAAKKIVSFDGEMGGLSPFQTKYPRLLCLGFSHKKGHGFTIPIDHADAPDAFRKAGKTRYRLIRILRNFFRDPDVPKVAQNEKFDRNHIRQVVGVQPVNVIDTIMMHYVQDERLGTHDLTSLSFAFTGMGGYEKELDHYKARNPDADPSKGGSYANIPGEILFLYNAMDADATRRVCFGLRKERDWKKNSKLRILAETYYPLLSRALAEVEWNGAMIDSNQVNALDKHHLREMAKLDKLIQRDPKVRRFIRDRQKENPKADASFNPDSWQQLGKILFGYYNLRPIELNDSGMDRIKSRLEARLNAWNEKPGKKLRDKPDFTDLVEEAIRSQEWDLFSTKADVLNEYKRAGNPLVDLILKFRAFSTLQGTFIEPLKTKLDAKNRIHGTFKPHGTVTARLSSSDPNLQNIPNKDGGKVKRCYVSRFGRKGVLLQADYSQIELRIAASLFKEPTMIRAYRRGDDLHTLTAIAISKLTPEAFAKLPKEVKKGWRTRAKRVNFGVLYGGGAGALVSTLQKDGVFITEKEAQTLIDAYFEARPVLKRNMDKLMASVRKLGYLEAFTGHRRRIPEVFSRDEKLVARALRQSVNFPVQCGASQMTNMALVLIHHELKRLGLRSKIVLTVHDSIVFDCHVDEFQQVGQIAKHIMENLPKLSDQVLPGIDWSWLTVPIVADLDVGFTWGTTVDLKEAKFKGEERVLDINDLDVDFLWDAMTERLAA